MVMRRYEPPHDAERVRSVSKALLGNRYRLEVGAAIAAADGEAVDAQSLSDETGVRYPRVQEQLKHLEAAGMVSRQVGATLRQEYKPEISVFWVFCTQLLAEVAYQSADPAPTGVPDAPVGDGEGPSSV
jgi:hypothetical protein